jgi:hypothetical protein
VGQQQQPDMKCGVIRSPAAAAAAAAAATVRAEKDRFCRGTLNSLAFLLPAHPAPPTNMINGTMIKERYLFLYRAVWNVDLSIDFCF